MFVAKPYNPVEISPLLEYLVAAEKKIGQGKSTAKYVAKPKQWYA